MGVLAAFVIYDVDIVFFVPEVFKLNSLTLSQFFFFSFFLAFFIIALFLDNRKGGFA
jgi:NADH:ubiquinone oxidoreductase subunit 3 (subunit A)